MNQPEHSSEKAKWLANPRDLHYRGELTELGVRVTAALEDEESARSNYPPIANGVTITQYQGPTIRFESPEEYAKWLIAGMTSDKPEDFAVDLHETWDSNDPTEIRKFQAELDRLCEEAGL